MRYVEARIDEFDRDEAYRIYVTTSLQLAPQSRYINKGYTDLVGEKEEEKSGDDIAKDIFERAELKFG